MRQMSLFWYQGGQLVEVEAWAEKDAALVEAERLVHSAEHLSMATWLNMSNVDQERIIAAYIPRRRHTAYAA